LQFWTDKSQPNIADHSHSWAQPRGWTARMGFEEILDIGFYDRRQFFNCKRSHTLGNVRDKHHGRRKVTQAIMPARL
jgi:hypothetical protein